jgi:hypothetical protein
MTGAIELGEPFSVRRFLAGAGGDSLAELAGTLAEQGGGRVAARVLRQASDSVRSAVGAEVMRSVDGLLDLDLGALLLAGWRKHRALTAAARESRAAPGTAVVRELAVHTVTSTHRPRVDLLVREKRVASVHLELSVRFTVRGLVATVRDGKLVALTGGDTEISADLSVEDRQLASRTRRVDLPLAVRLGNGIPLGRPSAPSGADAGAGSAPSAAKAATGVPRAPADPPDPGLAAVHLPGSDAMPGE